MAQDKRKQNKEWNRTYRHMNENSLADLSNKLNQRVVLHLFADSIQPDLLFREVEACLKAFDQLEFALIEAEIYRAFNACQNVEEAETLRDKLADNMDRVTGYLNSKSYKKRAARVPQEEQAVFLRTEDALYALWDRVNALLFTQEKPSNARGFIRTQEKKSAPAEPAWTRYERKPQEEQPALPRESPPAAEMPAIPPDTPPQPAHTPNVIQVTESSLMSIVTVLCLALIVFGAISALSGILGIRDLGFLDIMIYGSIWALCIVNLLFLFVYYASKLLHADIRDDLDPNATVFERYSIIFWADLILAEVLIFCLWLYLFREMVSYAWIIQAFHSMPSFFLIVGTILLLYLFYRAFVWLKSKTYGAGEAYTSSKEEMSLLSRQVRKGYKSAKVRMRERRRAKQEKARAKARAKAEAAVRQNPEEPEEDQEEL